MDKSFDNKMDKIMTANLQINTRLDELLLFLQNMNEDIKTIKNGKEHKFDDSRFENIEQGMKVLHIKIDTIKTSIIPTVISNSTVSKISTVEIETSVVEEKEETLQKFTNITEYFKYLWISDKQSLYDKGIVTVEFFDEIMKNSNESIEKVKKKGNEIMLQKSIALSIWKALPKTAKDKIQSMKSDHTNNVAKQNSKEIPAITKDDLK